MNIQNFLIIKTNGGRKNCALSGRKLCNLRNENLSKSLLRNLGILAYTYRPTIQEAKAEGYQAYGQSV